MVNAANAIIDSQLIRQVKGSKIVHAYTDQAYTVGLPALIYTDANGVFQAMSYTVTSAALGPAMVGLAADTIASTATGPFIVKGLATMASWSKATSGLVVTAMDTVGTVLSGDTGAVATAILRGYSIGITSGASSIILW